MITAVTRGRGSTPTGRVRDRPAPPVTERDGPRLFGLLARTSSDSGRRVRLSSGRAGPGNPTPHPSRPPLLALAWSSSDLGAVCRRGPRFLGKNLVRVLPSGGRGHVVGARGAGSNNNLLSSVSTDPLMQYSYSEWPPRIFPRRHSWPCHVETARAPRLI